VNGQSISDITRFAYQVTAYKIFAVNPIFGTGLGQFAFTADQFIPPWGYLSSEIRASMTFPEAPWPNTYSVYARIGAEIGIIGLIAWVGIWLATLTSVFSAGLAKERQGVRVPWEYYAILMANTALFASWVTSDTFRTALIWVTLGAAADVIGRKRHGLTQHASKPL
jgi:O-antigen ligase